MADDAKSLEIKIATPADVSGLDRTSAAADKATASVDKLTNTGTGSYYGAP